MIRLPLGSLRLRSILLVILAVIPAVTLLVHSDLENRQQALSQAKDDLLAMAKEASITEIRVISNTQQLLFTLSHFPPVIQRDAASCSKILAELMKNTKGYSALLAIKPDGLSFATYPPMSKPINLADRSYFKGAVKTGDFVIGEYILGRISGKPTLSMAYPVKNSAGELVAVLATGVGMDWLDKVLGQSALSKTAHLVLMDHTGKVMVHKPPEPEIIGKSFLKKSILQTILAQKEGVIEGNDIHGDSRLFGFSRLGKEAGAIYVLFSVAKEEVFAPGNRKLAQDLIWSGIAVLLALLAAWFIGTVSIVRPVKRLLKVTRRVTDGELGARIGQPYETGELGRLASGFDQMAESLQSREVERKQAEEELREKEERFRTVADFTYDWEWWRDVDGRFVYVSPSVQRITGYSAEEFQRDPDLLLRIVHPEDRAVVEKQLAADFKSDSPVALDFRLVTKGGETIWIEHISQPVFGMDGRRLGRRASNRDGTDRKRVQEDLAQQSALKTSQAELSVLMSGNLQTDVLARNIITFVCKSLKAQTGLMYLADGNGTLRLLASYAHKRRKHLASEYKLGEGLVGQAALEKQDIVVSNVPEDYIAIESGLGEAVPRNIYLKPIIYNDKVKAVIELGTLHEFGEFQSLFLDTVAESIAVTIESAEGREKLAESLEESQQLSEELQAQQEELKTANEELEDQTRRLRESEESLKAQQEELQVTNEELEEKNDLLERQTKEVERARKDIEVKAAELTLASKYKSEFLSNMSHELRTPLNSLLLLAQSLSENKEGNLSEEQVEFARIIHGSGHDLLNLINEILDLSKIEAGRMDLQLGTVRLDEVADGVRTSFRHMAEEKGLVLDVAVHKDAPDEIVSDKKRFEQVIRNFVSNAVKFTEKGSVTVSFGRPAPGTDLSRSGLAVEDCLAVAVKDTGIGINPEQQKIVFEAFQQADGGTARKYGGTGLGLSISRELARFLGGEIQLESELGKGSTFTLYIPVTLSVDRKVPAGGGAAAVAVSRTDESAASGVLRQDAAVLQIEDDRDKLEEGDRVILVVEDDSNFARLLLGKCHEKGFKCLAAPTGEHGLELASRYLPTAVILDIRLPGMDGWAVLDVLKENTSTRHIPVHVVSAEEAPAKALRKGAVGQTTKPLSLEDLDETFKSLEHASPERLRRVLVVEDDAKIRRKTVELISERNVKVDEAKNGKQAREALRSGQYDCVVLDLGLPDMDGHALLAKLVKEGVELPPVIVNTARDLTREEEEELRDYAESIIIKDVRSQERLLDEVSLFLHQVVNQMPEKKRQIIRDLHDTDTLLKDKKVLVVDDDMRTTFALSRLLSQRGMTPLKAENGQKALRILEEQPDVDLVLMDIMMPVMDGYEATERIRAQPRFQRLPIIVLTAKAMPEDREKCLAAGASDYLPKPVDEERLISMMRVWLCR